MLKTIPILFALLLPLARAGEAEGEAVDPLDIPFAVKCKLTTLDGKDTSRLRRFEITLAGATTQSLNGGGGIRVTLTIHNKASEPALIENPLDYLTYTLRNAAGELIAIPRPPPRAEILSIKETTREPRKLAYTLAAMQLNGEKLDDKVIDEDTLTIPATSKLTLHILIDKVAQAAYNKPEAAVIVPLTPGRYALTLRTAILLHREDGSAWFDSPPNSDPNCIRVRITSDK